MLEVVLNELDASVETIAEEFYKSLDNDIQQFLLPSLKSGAQRSSSMISDIVKSWGSKEMRSSSSNSEGKGLHWRTYRATALREGVYNSRPIGAIDLNQELCDPMEKR
jgi:hypothetical protein